MKEEIKKGYWVSYPAWAEGSKCKFNSLSSGDLNYTEKYYNGVFEVKSKLAWGVSSKSKLTICEPPKESPDYKLVFGKFSIGDIVVTLKKNFDNRDEGDLFRVLPSSDNSDIEYIGNKGNECSSNKINEWRLATEEECIAYNNGIKNINSINPTKNKTQFEKGDYIVLLKSKGLPSDDDSFKLNYCYKSRDSAPYIRPYIDTKGSKSNGHSSHPFNKSNNNDWRYATSEEIKHYDKIGGPYDVNELNTVKHLKSTVKSGDTLVHLVDYTSSVKAGDIVTFKEWQTSGKECYLTKEKGISGPYTENTRFATEFEIEAFKKGITNINDIKKESVKKDEFKLPPKPSVSKEVKDSHLAIKIADVKLKTRKKRIKLNINN